MRLLQAAMAIEHQFNVVAMYRLARETPREHRRQGLLCFGPHFERGQTERTRMLSSEISARTHRYRARSCPRPIP